MPKTSKRAQLIIDRCKNGQRLCKSHHLKISGNTETRYLLEPSGKRVSPKSAEEAINSGILVAANDGLFDASDSQTWDARR
jgi:tellurite resistance protein